MAAAEDAEYELVPASGRPAAPVRTLGRLNGRLPGEAAFQNLCFVTAPLAALALGLRALDAELGLYNAPVPPAERRPDEELAERQARQAVEAVVARLRAGPPLGREDGLGTLCLLRMLVREGRGWRLDDPPEAQQDSLEFLDELLSLLRVRPFFALERRSFHGALPSDTDRQELPGQHALFLDLPPPPPGGAPVTVRALLARHLSEPTPPVLREVLTRDGRRRLALSTPTLQCLVFTETPRVLIVALKRFAAGGAAGPRKVTTRVSVSQVLPTRPDEGAGNVELRCVVCHRGATLQSGHYTSFVAVPDPKRPGRSRWHEFDDMMTARPSSSGEGPDEPVAGLRPVEWSYVRERTATDGYYLVYERRAAAGGADDIVVDDGDGGDDDDDDDSSSDLVLVGSPRADRIRALERELEAMKRELSEANRARDLAESRVSDLSADLAEREAEDFQHVERDLDEWAGEARARLAADTPPPEQLAQLQRLDRLLAGNAPEHGAARVAQLLDRVVPLQDSPHDAVSRDAAALLARYNEAAAAAGRRRRRRGL